MLVAALVALPVVTVALHVFLPDQGAWRHIARVLLPEYVATPCCWSPARRRRARARA
jgi:hypothetical protein